MKNTITHASLFSGIGGPEIAAAMLGWENVFHCEINPFGKAVLDYWFPKSKSYEDITKTDFREWRGKVSVLTGGFPCQPFSYAGKRGGREDERYLWPEMLRAIDEIRPTWVVGENVAGLSTMVEGWLLSEMGGGSALFEEDKHFHDWILEQTFTIEKIAQELEHLGYSVQPVLIPAAAVGAPHRRDRIFIIAHIADPNGGDDLREPGEDAGEGGEERLQERDKVRVAGEPNQVRSTDSRADANADGRGTGTPGAGSSIEGCRCHADVLQGERGTKAERDSGLPFVQWAFENTLHGGFLYGQYEEQGNKRDKRDFSPGDNERICNGTSWADFTNTDCRDGEGECNLEGRKPGRDRLDRDGGQRDASDPVCPRCEGEDEPGRGEAGERMRVRGDLAGYGCEGLRPEHRWSGFPTVSPVHRGNDGLPFPLDHLTISPSQWRTESLKAYGNAIVPQVMYRIFQAIEKCAL